MKHDNPALFARLRDHLTREIADEAAREQRRVHAHLALFAICSSHEATLATVLDAVGNEGRAEQAIRDLVAARAVHRDGERVLPAFLPAPIPSVTSPEEQNRLRTQGAQLRHVREIEHLDLEALADATGLQVAELVALEGATSMLPAAEWRRLVAIYERITTADMERRRAWFEQMRRLDR